MSSRRKGYIAPPTIKKKKPTYFLGHKLVKPCHPVEILSSDSANAIVLSHGFLYKAKIHQKST